MIEAASAYLGSLAQLNRLGIYVSPPTDTLKSSQLYHLDGQDFHIVKCFINVHEVTPENGPFTFIPADESLKIRKSIGYHRKRGRISDKDVLALADKSRIVSLMGKPGTGAMVDTSSCFHYGSRCRAGHRVVIMLRYMRIPNICLREDAEFKQSGMGVTVNADSLMAGLSA